MGESKRCSWTVVVLVALCGWCVLTEAPAPAELSDEAPVDQPPIRFRFDPYGELCKGIYERPAALTSWLHCWYDVRNAYGTLAPSKVELVNLHPFIAIVHDVIHAGEIAKLQELGAPHIKQSGLTNDSWMPVFYENHQTYTLHDRDHPVVEEITQRVQQVSGLSCDSAEDLKVIYNEVGAFKTSDIDAAQKKEDLQRFAYSGNRLATVLLFLSDVEKGGYTIFPKLRVAIPAKKGAAVIWYNLKDTGEVDERLKYSLCPLQDDSKWTAKKYIHTRGNELRNPCQLKRQD